MPDPIHYPKCWSAHVGIWLCEPIFLREAKAAIIGGLWKPEMASTASSAPVLIAGTQVTNDRGSVLYTLTEDAVAVIELSGPMMKSRSKYGGASTLDARQALRAAASDKSVEAVLLVIESPGGTVAGTQQLADEIRATDSVKPVHTHFEDVGASAAYWVGSQARRISANQAAQIGSLGVYGVIIDSSKQAKMEGLEVHVISTGEQKGAFVDGTEVTPAQLAEAKKTVDSMNSMFKAAVASGRKRSPEETTKLFDGKVHNAETAKALGLIDSIESIDSAYSAMVAAIPEAKPASQPDNARRLRLARARP